MVKKRVETLYLCVQKSVLWFLGGLNVNRNSRSYSIPCRLLSFNLFPNLGTTSFSPIHLKQKISIHPTIYPAHPTMPCHQQVPPGYPNIHCYQQVDTPGYRNIHCHQQVGTPRISKYPLSSTGSYP